MVLFSYVFILLFFSAFVKGKKKFPKVLLAFLQVHPKPWGFFYFFTPQRAIFQAWKQSADKNRNGGA
jgi:hypothetical protein